VRGPLILAAIAIPVAAAALVAAGRGGRDPPRGGEETMPTSPTRRPLTPEEERVILRKGTERPFTGRFVEHRETGTYTCRRCGAPLFPSSAKFESGCGWPSFDDALPGAVREAPDADGVRTEIVCARCGGHLGHVFRGEGFTEKDTRHCVNSVSMEFDPAAAAATAAGDGKTGTGGRDAPEALPGGAREAFFAGGCFWGVEHFFDGLPGVIAAESGYMGGRLESPSYDQVLTGRTGHAETVRVTYDPSKVTYEQLAKRFFEIHDPTQVDRQGPDVGTQYRSVVFHADDEQRAVAERLVSRLRDRGLKVATRVEPAGAPPRFWLAEGYHQDWYAKKGTEPYCHARVPRFGD